MNNMFMSNNLLIRPVVQLLKLSCWSPAGVLPQSKMSTPPDCVHVMSCFSHVTKAPMHSKGVCAWLVLCR